MDMTKKCKAIFTVSSDLVPICHLSGMLKIVCKLCIAITFPATLDHRSKMSFDHKDQKMVFDHFFRMIVVHVS